MAKKYSCIAVTVLCLVSAYGLSHQANGARTSPPAFVPTDPPDLKHGPIPDEIKDKHFRAAGVNYERYLSDLLTKSGFAPESIKITSRSQGMRPGHPYRGLVFHIKGRATRQSVGQMLVKLRSSSPRPQISAPKFQKPQDPRVTRRTWPPSPSNSRTAATRFSRPPP
jgi:hypothetical protein